MNQIIAVDFDGTLCENKWPDIGEPNYKVIEYVKYEKSQGAKIILWTCRTGSKLINAIKFCKENGIELDAVNENLPEMIELFGEDTRKIFADEYIEDKSVIPFGSPYRLAMI